MNIKDNWDLECLLENHSLETLYKEWYDCCSYQCNLLNDFYKTQANFKKWLELDLQTTKIFNRLTNYITNHNNEDLANPKWIKWMQKLTFDLNSFSQKMHHFNALVIQNEQQIKKYLLLPQFQSWKREFALIFKCKNHILDSQSEHLLSKLNIDSSAINDIFSTITDVDIKFANALDSHKKVYKLSTFNDVIKALKSNDKNLRKSTWLSYNKAFFQIKNTLSKTLYYNYLRVNAWARVRNFPDYISQTLFNDEVDEKLLLFIYDKTKIFQKLFLNYKKYHKEILKKIFKFKILEPWDLFLDLSNKQIKYTIEDAQQEIISALTSLGDQYQKLIKIAFAERWISWLPKKNKMSGAYSIGSTYGLSKYFILTNFDNTINAVSTIAHELGHSINSYFINKKQTIYAETEMFCAEIPSLVNEMILNLYWLKKYKFNKKKKLLIYDSILSTFFATTVRQIIFSKFEYEANKIINSGSPFTFDVIEDLYFNLRKQYEGFSKEEIAKAKTFPYNLGNLTILRIPHFYLNNFYVYKYAIGQLVALVIATRIFNNEQKTINKYYEFLSLGTSMPPLEMLKFLGIDLNKNDVYFQAKKIIEKLLNNFKKIIKNWEN